MNRRIETKRALAAIREVVAEKGADYVYPRAADPLTGEGGSCVNVERDDNDELIPSCIVGHVLHRLGVPLANLEDFAEDEAGCLIEGLDLRVANKLSNALRVAQEAQDTGAPWGKALKKFEKALK